MVLGFASFVCTIGEEAALGGPILAGIGLSGSDRDERDSNLLDISTFSFDSGLVVLGHRFEITIDYRFIIGQTKPTSYRLCNRLN